MNSAKPWTVSDAVPCNRILHTIPNDILNSSFITDVFFNINLEHSGTIKYTFNITYMISYLREEKKLIFRSK